MVIYISKIIKPTLEDSLPKLNPQSILTSNLTFPWLSYFLFQTGVLLIFSLNQRLPQYTMIYHFDIAKGKLKK